MICYRSESDIQFQIIQSDITVGVFSEE